MEHRERAMKNRRRKHLIIFGASISIIIVSLLSVGFMGYISHIVMGLIFNTFLVRAKV